MAKLCGVCLLQLLTASIKKGGADRDGETVKQEEGKKGMDHHWWCGTATLSTFLSVERQKNAGPINQSQL